MKLCITAWNYMAESLKNRANANRGQFATLLKITPECALQALKHQTFDY
jgi:hypothetical protein